MRLTEHQLSSIRFSFLAVFSEQDHLWLFGSRVNDTMRGGDIDLYIETTESDSSILFDKKLKFACNLEQALGEQKIDIVVKMLSQNKSLRIYEEARNTGILLV